MLPPHPTILIGCGTYGRAALRRALHLAHDRGVLVWEEVAEAHEPTIRRIKQLALVVVPSGPNEDTAAEGDLARDLYSNISEVPANRPDIFAETVLRHKEILLDAGRRSADPDRLRFGLDVIVLAQPAGADQLGNLESLLQPVMDRLANDRSLQRPAQGADLLNFTLIFDFDRYWDQSKAGSALRREIQAFVQRWAGRQANGRPSFSRIYLCDGQTGDGRRSEALRIEETAMLTGLLLFEGLRQNANLRAIYQRENDESPALGAFGVRSIERAKILLTRLGAAKFASGWLEYLGGSNAPTGPIREMTDRLEGYLPERIDSSAEREELERTLERGLGEIERQLVDWTMQTAGEERWPGGIREIAERAAIRVRSELSAVGGECGQRLVETRLSQLSERLKEEVTRALCGSPGAAPVGAAIEALRGLERQLQVMPAPPSAPQSAAPDDPFVPIDEIHREFADMRNAQIDHANLKPLWPLLAIIAAAAWTPIALAAADELTPPDPSAPFVARLAYLAAMALAQPWIVALLSFGLAWLAGALWFDRQVAARIERARLVFLHPGQGRLIAALRRLVRHGTLGSALRTHADQAYRDMLDRLRVHVRREVDRILEMLVERQLEAGWLRGQMREFLRTRGVDPDDEALVWREDREPRAGYRVSIEAERSLRRILAKNPATRERFRSIQSESRILDRWSDRYCDAFLYPVTFLERLSEYYEELPTRQAASAENDVLAAAGARDIVDAIGRFGQFPLAFEWGAATGAAVTTEHFCILPEEWRALPGVVSALNGQAFPEHRIVSGADPDIAYLLRVQLGVPSARLADDETHAPPRFQEATDR